MRAAVCSLRMLDAQDILWYLFTNTAGANIQYLEFALCFFVPLSDLCAGLPNRFITRFSIRNT